MLDETSLEASQELQFPLLGGAVQLSGQFILENAYLRPEDCAFVGGSLLEGLGNRYSDVDVHVITPSLRKELDIRCKDHFRVLSPDRSTLTGSAPDKDVFLIHTVVPGSHIKIDIEYRTFLEVEALASTISETFEYATTSLLLLTKYLPQRDLAFLHRLFHSPDIAGHRILERFRAMIDVRKFQYLMYRWKASDYSVLLDMLGAWEDCDWIRCADLARENAVTQFQAYTHLCGNTNYHRKWILSYASRLDVEDRLLKRFIGILSTGFDDERSVRHFIAETLDFVDELFAASDFRLEALKVAPFGRDALAIIDQCVREEAGDYSRMEIAYRQKVYGRPENPTKDWFGDV